MSCPRCTSFKENLRRLFVGENTSGTSDEQDSPNRRETNKRLVDFDALLKHASFSEELSSQEFQSWMERSRVNCILTGNILSNAKEAVECLNQIMSWLIVGGTLILWLILTGVATTKVIVLIASPLLAATFIFGDTCKSFFQGIMFVYVVHPFDVGDLCAIDEKMMEVKSIGVWKTIFSNVDKVGGQEEVIILNSELAHKTVINHKSEFDCNDYVEFILESHNNEKIEKLISQIEEYLNREDNRFTTSSHSVAVLTIENNMKIAVCFEHKINLKDATYFECRKTKDKRRTALIIYTQNLVKELTEAPTPEQIRNSGFMSFVNDDDSRSEL